MSDNSRKQKMYVIVMDAAMKLAEYLVICYKQRCRCYALLEIEVTAVNI